MLSFKKGCLGGALLMPALGIAASGTEHNDPIAPVLLGVTILFFFAILGRFIARRLHQPGVLGELLMGVFVGNIAYYCGNELIILLREGSAIFTIVKHMLGGMPLKEAVDTVITNPIYAHLVTAVLSSPWGTEYLKVAYIIDIFSRYGVIFLLFMVGLESSVSELKHTGREAIGVALIGVAAPMLLGFATAYLLLPHSSLQTDLFLGATLSATSIGITARVLKEMNKLKTREARTILGAAMLDDILGLIILAVVSGIVVGGVLNFMVVIKIVIYSLLFFVGALTLGPIVVRKLIYFFRFLESWEAKLFVSFFFVMLLSWLASSMQLAAIIGAFSAGVILHDDYFNKPTTAEKTRIQHLFAPLEAILAPLFFVVIGIQVKLETFLHIEVIMIAAGLILAAVVGKLVSGYGANKKDDRLLVGIGMLPRGEVGLVFASIGRTLNVMSDELFSAVVLMVVVTTFLAPSLLKARYAFKARSLKIAN